MRERVLLRTHCSVLHFSETVLEEEESGALICLVLLVGESQVALVVVALTSEDLELVELASDKLDKLGGTLLEFRNTVRVGLTKSLGGLCQESLSPGHEISLAPATDFFEAELVDDVNDSLGLTIILFLLVGGDQDGLLALSDVLGLGLDASVVKADFVLEGVGEELVTRDKINEHSHDAFCFLSVCLVFCDC